MTRRIPPLLLTLWVATTVAAAPADAQTRSAEAAAARAAKAAQLQLYAPGRVERLLNRIEADGQIQRLFTPRDGFGVRFGGIDGGSPIAAGPAWRHSALAGGRLEAFASGAFSLARDAEGEAGVALPQAGTPRLALGISAAVRHLANERYFGAGADSVRADATAFAVDRREVTATGRFQATNWLTIAGSGGSLTAAAADAAGRRVPAISTRFTEAGAPGLTGDATFTVVSLATTVDYRDVPMNPRAGGRYHVAVSRYTDAGRDEHSFTRIDAEFEQHLSAWKRQRVLTLRAVASGSMPDANNQVPFYLQPTLGGSRLLRGFVTDRFRDNTLVAFQAEYGWDVTPFLNAVAFYETGTVAPRWGDIASGEFRRDYGLGFRFGSARTVAFRTDVALGSGEGPRITMRFNHAF